MGEPYETQVFSPPMKGVISVGSTDFWLGERCAKEEKRGELSVCGHDGRQQCE